MKNLYYTVEKKEKIVVEVKSYPILYKYQAINDYSKKALLNSEIWGTVPTAFNDPYDSVLCYTKSKIEKAIIDRMSKERYNNYSKFYNTNSKKDIIKNIEKGILENYNNNFRNNYCVACFSEIVDSEIMWGHYANNARGFALAYEGKGLQNLANQHLHKCYELLKLNNIFNFNLADIPEEKAKLAPVLYLPGKRNCDQELISNLNNLLYHYDGLCSGINILEAVKELFENSTKVYYQDPSYENNLIDSAVFNKARHWSYEKEWRLWSYNTNIFESQAYSPHVLLGTGLQPKAVYLGEFINQFDEIAIREIAKNKLFVPLYKMRTIVYKNRCKLKAIEIT